MELGQYVVGAVVSMLLVLVVVVGPLVVVLGAGAGVVAVWFLGPGARENPRRPG
jgi:hypothetical protein